MGQGTNQQWVLEIKEINQSIELQFDKMIFLVLRVFTELRADASVMKQNTNYFQILDNRLKSVNNGNNFLVEVRAKFFI